MTWQQVRLIMLFLLLGVLVHYSARVFIAFF